jgi:hypothetical protein
MRAGLTDEQLRQLAENLMGTTDSIETALEALGLDQCDFDVTDVEDALLDYNVELCPGCSWWFDSGELNDGEGCDDCVVKEEDE